MAVLFDTVAFIGVGLIGGSMARAIKKNAICNKIIGYGRRKSELEKALSLGVIDEIQTSIVDAISDADLVVLALPIGGFEDVFRECVGNLKKDVVITDVGSAKQIVFDSAIKIFGKIPEELVPAHPIAGTEKSGVEASFDSLFCNRCTIVTPDDCTSKEAIEKVTQLWERIGAEVVLMDSKHHDLVLAATSHLPHVLAFSLVDTLGKMHEHSEIFKFAAGGFRDFTRIASSDPAMWRDICLYNKEAIIDVLRSFESQLKNLEMAITKEDKAGIEEIFFRAKTARDEHITL